MLSKRKLFEVGVLKNKRYLTDLVHDKSIEVIGITVGCIVLLGIIRFSFNYLIDINKNIKVITDKVEVITDKVEVITDKVEVITDKAEVITDKVEVITDKAEVITDKVEVITDKVEVITDKVEVITSNITLVDEVNENINRISQGITFVSEKVDIISSYELIGIDYIKAKLDLMQASLTDAQGGLTSILHKTVFTNVEQLNILLEKISGHGVKKIELIELTKNLIKENTEIISNIPTTSMPIPPKLGSLFDLARNSLELQQKEASIRILGGEINEQFIKILDQVNDNSEIIIHKINNILTIVSHNSIAPLLENPESLLIAGATAALGVGAIRASEALGAYSN